MLIISEQSFFYEVTEKEGFYKLFQLPFLTNSCSISPPNLSFYYKFGGSFKFWRQYTVNKRLNNWYFHCPANCSRASSICPSKTKKWYIHVKSSKTNWRILFLRTHQFPHSNSLYIHPSATFLSTTHLFRRKVKFYPDKDFTQLSNPLRLLLQYLRPIYLLTAGSGCQITIPHIEWWSAPVNFLALVCFLRLCFSLPTAEILITY